MKTRILSALLFLVPAFYIVTRTHEIEPHDRAKAICRGEIVKRLKDPATAEFGASSAMQSAGGRWVVYRDVMAKNSFDAMVKSTMRCDVAADFETVRVTRALQP